MWDTSDLETLIELFEGNARASEHRAQAAHPITKTCYCREAATWERAADVVRLVIKNKHAKIKRVITLHEFDDCEGHPT